MKRRSFETRHLEVFLAAITACFGIWLLLPGDSMGSPAWAEARGITSEANFGRWFLFNGLTHFGWLAVNGGVWWSPLIRLAATAGSSALYLILALSIAAYDINSTGVFTYFALAMGAAVCCAYAWRDAILAARVYRASHNF